MMAPSTKFAPGSIVRVTHKDKFEADIICTPDRVLGEEFAPLVSNTVSIKKVSRNRKAVKFNVDVASLAGGSVDLHAIKNVQAVVANPKILYVSMQQVSDNLRNISNRCLYALATLKRLDADANQDITMISSVILADASYSVEWNNEAALDLNAKVLQLANLAADLHLDAARVGTEAITAKGVYWGVQTNKTLAALVNEDIIRHVPADTLFMPSDVQELGKVISGLPLGQNDSTESLVRSPRSRPPSRGPDMKEATPEEAEDTLATLDDAVDATVDSVEEESANEFAGVGDIMPPDDIGVDEQAASEPAAAADDGAAKAADEDAAAAPDSSAGQDDKPVRPPLTSRSSGSSARMPPHMRNQ